jgi:hypothetical protein
MEIERTAEAFERKKPLGIDFSDTSKYKMHKHHSQLRETNELFSTTWSRWMCAGWVLLWPFFESAMRVTVFSRHIRNFTFRSFGPLSSRKSAGSSTERAVLCASPLTAFRDSRSYCCSGLEESRCPHAGRRSHLSQHSASCSTFAPDKWQEAPDGSAFPMPGPHADPFSRHSGRSILECP